MVSVSEIWDMHCRLPEYDLPIDDRLLLDDIFKQAVRAQYLEQHLERIREAIGQVDEMDAMQRGE